jgi:hypothetical protein
MSDADFERRIADYYEQYREVYDIDDMVNPNDIASLLILIRYQVLIEMYQKRMAELAEENIIENAQQIKKISDLLRDATSTFIQFQRDLGIDRRTRKESGDETIGDYINDLLNAAQSFHQQRLTYIVCSSCGGTIGRIAPIYDTGGYRASFWCPICSTWTTVEQQPRKEEKEPWRAVKEATVIIPSKQSPLFTFDTDT